MKRHECLTNYLLRNIRARVIDFAIRAEERPGGGVKFYIHPAAVSGDTLDFLCWENPENDMDLLINEQDCPPANPERVKALLCETLDRYQLREQVERLEKAITSVAEKLESYDSSDDVVYADEHARELRAALSSPSLEKNL